MKPRTVALLFVVGSFIGTPMALLYIRYSPSVDRFFHAFVMLAAIAFSAPSVVVLLRMTLRMWEMAVEQRATMLELRDSIKPFVVEGRGVIEGVKGVIEDLKNQKAGKIIEFIEKIEKDGLIPKIVLSMEEIGRQVGDAVRRFKHGKGGEVEVPVIPRGRTCVNCWIDVPPVADGVPAPVCPECGKGLL
jgi:hypothetical protein